MSHCTHADSSSGRPTTTTTFGTPEREREHLFESTNEIFIACELELLWVFISFSWHLKPSSAIWPPAPAHQSFPPSQISPRNIDPACGERREKTEGWKQVTREAWVGIFKWLLDEVNCTAVNGKEWIWVILTQNGGAHAHNLKDGFKPPKIQTNAIFLLSLFLIGIHSNFIYWNPLG